MLYHSDEATFNWPISKWKDNGGQKRPQYQERLKPSMLRGNKTVKFILTTPSANFIITAL